MANKDLETLLWLTPTAKDLLRSISKTLRGAVPCPAAQLASALGEADISEGLLGSASVRKAWAAELQALGGEVSDKTAPKIADALGKVLMKEVEAIKQKANAIKGKVPKQKKGEAMPGFQAVAPLQVGKQVTDAMRMDWLMWHAPGNGHSKDLVFAPSEAVVADRAALAACIPDGPVGEFAIAMHVLENLDAYIKWELSFPGSKPPTTGIQVKCPFDDKMANEVAIRRTLTAVLAPDVAMAVIGEAGGAASKLPAALQKLAADARKQAIIPLYTAPPAPKEPKGPKDAKDKKREEG